MKANEALKVLQITRNTLSKYARNGTIVAQEQGNERYVYDNRSVYEYVHRDTGRIVVGYTDLHWATKIEDYNQGIKKLNKYITSTYKDKRCTLLHDLGYNVNIAEMPGMIQLIELITTGIVGVLVIEDYESLNKLNYTLVKRLCDKFGTDIKSMIIKNI